MAKLSVIICDLCKSLSKADLPYALSLQAGKGRDKEVTKAEICSGCYERLHQDIVSDFDFDKVSLPRNTRKPPVKEVAEGESIVPSNLANIAPPPQKPSCQHDRKQFDPPMMKCKDCGDEWRA